MGSGGWTAEDHKAFRQGQENDKIKESCITEPQSLSASTMRNWVIKTICGFDTHLLNRFQVIFPDLAEEFESLHKHAQEVLAKVRAANQKKSKG